MKQLVCLSVCLWVCLLLCVCQAFCTCRCRGVVLTVSVSESHLISQRWRSSLVRSRDLHHRTTWSCTLYTAVTWRHHWRHRHACSGAWCRISPYILLGRPCTVVTGGLIKCSWCFFFFFLSPRVLRGPSADRRETLPHDRKLAGFNNAGPKFRGPPPKKSGGQKHAKFWSILYNLRLWSRISPERLKISKNGKLIHRWQYLLRYMKKVLPSMN